MSRRHQIRMTNEEIRSFLDEKKTLVLVSNGPGGFPHPMPMWFHRTDDGAIHMATYAKSQKIKNLQRDNRVALLAESGEVYQELKGVVLYGRAEVIDDYERVVQTLLGANKLEDNEQTRAGVAATAAKRLLIRVKPERVVTWDHRKLGAGVY